jgi:hypothetical protein
MRIKIFVLLFILNLTAYAQDEDDYFYDEYYDTGMAEGLTIYGERPWDAESINAHVLNQLNGSLSDRKKFIETEFLEGSGFRRTGNVKYRKTTGSEKASSVFTGIARLLSFGIVPSKPFSEIEYDRLPKGEFYKFQSVFIKSNFKGVTLEVFILMELEYMLQIEFCNGILIQENKNYYTDAHIDKFEKLVLRLPDFPENILQAKNRYLNELQKLKAVFERYRNPSENYLRAMENLGSSFKINSNR